MLSLREREKKDSRGDKREGQERKWNRNKNEETRNKNKNCSLCMFKGIFLLDVAKTRNCLSR